MSNDYYADVREKRKILRDLYGGMMTIQDLANELGYGSRTSARAWLAQRGLPPVRVGNSKRYETDLVAKSIVDERGMC